MTAGHQKALAYVGVAFLALLALNVAVYAYQAAKGKRLSVSWEPR